MKTTLLIILTFCTQIGISQSEFDDFIKVNYTLGSDSFLETVYSSIEYPAESRINCITGKLYVTINIDQKGSLAAIDYSQNLNNEIITSVDNALKKCSDNWVKNKPQSFTFTVAFNIGDKENINGDLNIIASGAGRDKKTVNCPLDSELLDQFEKLVKKGRFNKAQKILNILLSRDPKSKRYLKLQKQFNA